MKCKMREIGFSHFKTHSATMATIKLFILSSMFLLKIASGALRSPDSYTLASFTQSAEQWTTLDHFAFDNRTGNVYVAADKYLYHLTSNFNVSDRTGISGSECVENPLCQDSSKILAIVPGEANSLVTCRRSDGLCAIRSLTDISQVLNPRMGMEVVVPGDSADLTSVGVVAPGPSSAPTLYVANTLNRGVASIINPIRRWDVESSLFDYSSGNLEHINLQLQNFEISYKGAFTYNGNVYFVMNQDDGSGRYLSKLGRVCYEADEYLASYTEITLRCESRSSPGSSYSVVQAAHVGHPGGSLRDSLNGSESVLFAVFSSSSSDTVYDSSSSSDASADVESALCTYSMDEVETAFLQAVKDCLSGSESAVLSYISNAACNTVNNNDDSRIKQILCNTGDVYRYANGIQDLTSSAALEFSGSPTSIVSSVERQHTVAFIGTDEGTLEKVHLMNSTSARIYETLNLGATPVLPDMYNVQGENILVATQEKLYRLSVASCGQYSTCDECIGSGGAGDGDPYCGWCTLEARCTRYAECPNPDTPDRWLAYDTAECISISGISPPHLPKGDTQTQENVRFSVAHLPILPDDSTYFCFFGGIPIENTVTVGNNVTCLSPLANELPPIQPGRDHVSVTLSLHVDRSPTPIVSIDYSFYNCRLITSCSSCASSQWGCDWCVYDNSCTHDRSSCHQDDTIVTGTNNAEEAVMKGPEWCPHVFPLLPETDIPVGIPRGFQLQASNLPNVDSYECVLHIEGREQRTPARLVNQSSLVCQEQQYSYSGQSLKLNVPVSVRWDGINDVDTVGDLNVTLYNCSFERDSCSRCVSPRVTPLELRCGWCGNRCDVRGSPNCPAVSWIPQASNRSCPGPVVTKISPTSGPIEGNTLVDISGTDLGFTFTDITGIRIGSLPCMHAGLKDRYLVGSRISCVTTASSMEADAEVSISVLDSGNTVQQSGGMVLFSYKDPSISSFTPGAGLAFGGTLVTIGGASLNAGANISAHIGAADCDIESISKKMIQCRTGPGNENSTGAVTLRFDGALRQSARVFSYRPNPTFTRLSQQRTIRSGGINITISGKGFGIVQDALLIAALISDSNVTSSEACYPEGDTTLICPSPSFPGTTSTPQSTQRRRRGETVRRPRRRRRRRQAQEATLSLSLDGYLIDVMESFEFAPDPHYEAFNEPDGIKDVTGNTTLRISGTNIDDAVTKKDVMVKIGSGSCEVLSISSEELFCRLPSTQPQVGDTQGMMGTQENDGEETPHPAVIVMHGGNLRFHLGYVRYKDTRQFRTLLAIIIASLIGVFIVFILIIVSVYGRRVHQHKLKSAEGALISLEERLKDKATEAFHDLQRDMSGLREQLQGVGMPFVSGADYIRNMLFWGLKVQPMTRDPEERVGKAMMEFSKCLNKKEFLKAYIQGLDATKTLQQKDRVNIASLLSIILTTEGRFHYLTEVMLTLMAEKIAESDENRLKQLFRRTESILEKLISNWIALCMYKHLQKQVAYPLYVLYQAIKGQCEKGPVDGVTGQSHFSLNFDYLLDEDIEFEEVTLQVVDREYKVTEQVKVLDIDTITQAKQKILDAIYCKRQTAQQLRSNEVDLMLINGQSGQLVLRDRDDRTQINGNWVRANTIKTYQISNGSSVAIMKKPSDSEANFGGALDKQELAYSSNHTPAVHNFRPSWDYTQIDMGAEEGKQMWHLVKEESSAAKSKHKSKSNNIDNRPKLIKEVYTSRLLVTKNAVQHFLDEFLLATFSLPEGQSSLPAHIKHLFDFFDQQADEHGSLKENIAETWKNNSLPLRFWVTAISHPSFIFDMQQSQTADHSMNVLTYMLDHACKKIVPKYNLDASLNRILYRPELPRYIKMIGGYYEAVADLPKVSDAQLEDASQQISKEFCSHFSRLGMLYQLYEFTKEHTDMLDKISAIIEERED